MFDYLTMTKKGSDCTITIAVMLNQMCIIGAGTHLGAGVRSAFVFPSATIAQAFTLTFIGNAALRKGPQRF